MVKNRKASKTVALNETRFKGLRIFLLAAVSLVIFYPPYLQGLFFEKDVLPTAIYVFALFILFCVYKWIKKDYTFFKTPIDYAALGFVIVYAISLFTAVHTRSAIIELMKYCMYFAVFYMISDLADSMKTRKLFLWIIIASAMGVSIIGLDSAIGGNLVRMLNKIFNVFGVQGNMFFGLFVSNRIHSTLQYPNALAAYVMAVFFITIGLLMTESKVWVKAVCGACAYALFLTFMLTQSAGALLLFPVVLVFFFAVSPKGKRINATAHSILPAIPAALISFLVRSDLSETEFSKRAFTIMLTGLIVSVILSIAIKYIGAFLQKVNWKVYAALAVVLIIVIPIGAKVILNASVPLEISHDIFETDGVKQVSQDITLIAGKEYILRYTAETTMQEEKQYAYNVRISNKNRKNILFGGDMQIVSQNIKEATDEENDIHFVVPEDSNLINIRFLNYYAGTSVTLDNARIIDPQTGKTVKEVILKNKYNLESNINRIRNIRYDRSGLTRLIFYQDGIKIFRSYWLFGGGGGAWEYLYRQYQSYNYQSTQAHNYPLQLGIETGILGLLILLFLVIILLNLYFKYYKKHNEVKAEDRTNNNEDSSSLLTASIAAGIAALLLHSIIDFDFSEAAMLLLFWQLIAIFNSEIKASLAFTEMMPANWTTSKSNKSVNNARGKAGMGFSALLCIVLLVFASNFVKASVYARKAYENLGENKMEEAITNINEAIDKDKYNERYVIGYNPMPTRPDIKAGLADILLMKSDLLQKREQYREEITQAELGLFQRQFAVMNDHIKRIEENRNNNLNLTNNLASFCFSTGQVDKGLEYLNEGIKLFPFEPSIWQSKVNVYYQIMSRYFNESDYAKAEKYLSSALNVIQDAMQVNEGNMSPFIFDEDTIKSLQTMQFMRGNWGNNEELRKINEIVHYTVPYMDINQDGLPDQWISGNPELINISASEHGIDISSEDGGYIYTRHPIKLEKGKNYAIEIIVDKAVDTMAYQVVNITRKTVFQAQGQNKYTAEFLVENDPRENGNQFRLYFDSDCIIQSITMVEKK
jgi:tetratricopeptide (TPR) repeat protein